MLHRNRAVTILAAGLLFLAGCGDSGGESEDSAAPSGDAGAAVSEVCANGPGGITPTIAIASSLSSDDAAALREDIAGMTEALADVSEADGFAQAFEEFGAVAEEQAIARGGEDVPTAKQDQLVLDAKAKAADEARSIGADACVALLGG